MKHLSMYIIEQTWEAYKNVLQAKNDSEMYINWYLDHIFQMTPKIP